MKTKLSTQHLWKIVSTALFIVMSLLIAVLLYAFLESFNAVNSDLRQVESQESLSESTSRHEVVSIAANIDQDLRLCVDGNGSTYGLMDCYQRAQTAYEALVAQVQISIISDFDEWIIDRRSWSSNDRHDEVYIEGLMEAKKDVDTAHEYFLKYRGSLCDYAYNVYNDGSVRYLMADSCRLEVTKSYLKEICAPMSQNSACQSL